MYSSLIRKLCTTSTDCKNRCLPEKVCKLFRYQYACRPQY